MGAILSQKHGQREHVITFANKGLSSIQRHFHPMEGECYAFIWGIMHFKQYMHMNHFTLKTDHKPLQWLAVMSSAYGKRGKWVDML
jgi:hypothetical protein